MLKKIFLMSLVVYATMSWAAGSKAPKRDDAMNETNAEGVIQGMVKSDNSAPLENVVIVITETTARGPIKDIAPLSNYRGEFSIRDLPPGEYTIQASRPGFAPQKMKVKVEGKKTSAVEFIMRE